MSEKSFLCSQISLPKKKSTSKQISIKNYFEKVKCMKSTTFYQIKQQQISQYV
jgi:hypothetical protein